ncbi:phage resistance protein, partial [Nannocystis pusilla]
MSTQIRDLFQIPAEIRPMDFTVVLADGVTRPEDTVSTYRVTPALARAFGQSLDLVAAALRDGRSQAAYLHGSFGTGKSHFMALLSLLLAGEGRAWSLPELAPLRPAHAWAGERKLLQLRLHMLDQPSFEGAIFGAYLAHLRAHHPDAPLPLLFADVGLFDDADAVREQLGDAAFFAALEPPQQAGRWGKLAGTTWDRARFDAARKSTSPQERADLLTALARTPFFRSFREFTGEQRRSYVDFDAGLQELTRHAQSLGYAAVVLFLDELILWLSMNAGRPDFISAWVGRMVKLVQGDHARRHIPIVSFIARQKELRFMIGEENVGPDQAHAEEVLKLAKGRFGEIRLEDENLPAIVEKRVLIPRDADAVAAIDRTFAAIEKQAGASWNTLLGS